MATNPATYKFNHSMIRVKDPTRSIKFYNFLGMEVVHKQSMPEAKFDLYFLGFNSTGAVSHGKHHLNREGLIELTHNYGTENDDNFKVNNGNEEPHRGFGHTCISVDHMQAACKRIEDAGYRFKKKYTEGRMRHIAFVLDPDGYWVEIIAQNSLEATENVTTTDIKTYCMNHTMLRVKDIQKSLYFYQEVLGFDIVRTTEMTSAGFNLYFLSYNHHQHNSEDITGDKSTSSISEGLLELTWNYGTEKDDAFRYHNGNDEPQGFGHICISVDNIDAACKLFDDLNVSWKKRLTDGRMKNIAFILDPDGYSVEIIENEAARTASLTF